MTQISTFSAAVDDVIVRSGRPDRLADAISFVRMSIRELQTIKGYMFDHDIVEDQITANAEPYVWTPDTTIEKRWRTMRSVQYPEIFAATGNPIYAHYVGIGMKQNEYDYYYYKTGNSYVFVGASGDDSTEVAINLAYYSYSPILAYESVVADRVASFELETNVWTYLEASDDDEEIAARLLVTNWLLEKWYDSVIEGALAKLYKTVDDDRARSSFALYSSYKKTLTEAEPRSHFGVQI